MKETRKRQSHPARGEPGYRGSGHAAKVLRSSFLVCPTARFRLQASSLVGLSCCQTGISSLSTDRNCIYNSTQRFQRGFCWAVFRWLECHIHDRMGTQTDSCSGYNAREDGWSPSTSSVLGGNWDLDHHRQIRMTGAHRPGKGREVETSYRDHRHKV